MNISMIVGIGAKREIGAKNKLLCHISEDLKNFKAITLGHHILMGRSTFESIGRPLPGRTNLVLSHSLEEIEGCILVRSVEEALKICQKAGERELIVIGGAKVYEQTLPLIDTLYLSRVAQDYPEADTYFPEFESAYKWSRLDYRLYPQTPSHPEWTFEILTKPSISKDIPPSQTSQQVKDEELKSN